MRPAQGFVVLRALGDLQAARIKGDCLHEVAPSELQSAELMQGSRLTALVVVGIDQAQCCFEAFSGLDVITEDHLNHAETNQGRRLTDTMPRRVRGRDRQFAYRAAV